MIDKTAEEGAEHKALVQKTIAQLEQLKKKDIRAHAAGYDTPDEVQGLLENFIPDVTAEGLIAEVETADTIDISHTTSQWRAFADHAAKNKLEFWVVVRKDSVSAAKKRLNELGIDAEVHGA